MGLRRARELVVLMVKQFQPYGATWAELMEKSGMAPTTYKRALNWTVERKWFVGGGKQGAAYNLNPDGCWRAALAPPDITTDPVNPVLTSETRTDGPSLDLVRPLGEAESHLALMNEAIAHVDQKKRS